MIDHKIINLKLMIKVVLLLDISLMVNSSAFIYYNENGNINLSNIMDLLMNGITKRF